VVLYCTLIEYSVPIVSLILLLLKYSHYLISDPGNVFQVFGENWYPKMNIHIVCLLINIIHHKTGVYFCLRIVFLKAYYHNSQKQGYTKPIFMIGVRRATFLSNLEPFILIAQLQTLIKVAFDHWNCLLFVFRGTLAFSSSMVAFLSSLEEVFLV
jgi:hypothetical protein